MAECSESIGRSHASGLAIGELAGCRAARFRARGITRCPPATSVSLLAVATILPARSAASTGRRLTTPPVATITRSTSSRVATSSSAGSPTSTSSRSADPGCRCVEPPRGSRPAPASGQPAAPGLPNRGRPPAPPPRTPPGRAWPGRPGSDGRSNRSTPATRAGWACPVRRAGQGPPGTRTWPVPRTAASRPGRGCRRGRGSGCRSPWCCRRA